VRWKWRWTVAILTVVLLMFVAGTSLVGLAHQAVWLATSPEPMYDEVLGRHGGTDPESLSNRMKLLGMGVGGFQNAERGLLPESLKGRWAGLHSWETLLAPHIFYYLGDVRLDKSWDDPANAPIFRKLFAEFLNPAYPTDTWRNDEGYGQSHYAANERVLGPDGVSNFDQISDGTGNTVLIGEVDANFEPWGKPGNWRDPTLGLNRSPNGFGCRRAARVVYFVMADGSVRHFREGIDPEVLRALATPTAGDDYPASP
jgi:hypothetical protein